MVLLHELLGDGASVGFALTILPLVLCLSLAFLVELGWCVVLHEVPSEQAVESVTQEISLTLRLDGADVSSELVLKLEISLAHFVLEATDVGRLANDSLLFLLFKLLVLLGLPLGDLLLDLFASLLDVLHVAFHEVVLLLELLLLRHGLLHHAVGFRNDL